MTYGDLIDVLRLVDAVLASVVFALMVRRLTQSSRSEYSRDRWLYVALSMYSFSVAYTSFELYQQDAEVGLRSWTILVANLIALYAVWCTRCRSGSSVG